MEELRKQVYNYALMRTEKGAKLLSLRVLNLHPSEAANLPEDRAIRLSKFLFNKSVDILNAVADETEKGLTDAEGDPRIRDLTAMANDVWNDHISTKIPEDPDRKFNALVDRLTTISSGEVTPPGNAKKPGEGGDNVVRFDPHQT